jgi:hypothetical protein
MKKSAFNRGLWWFSVYLIRTSGLLFQLSPQRLPRDEGRKIQAAILPYDVVIIFNPGGWGDASLERARDFAPVLAGIQQTLKRLQCPSVVVPYTRTATGLPGRISGTKEQLNSFKHSAAILARDIEYLARKFPEKRFIIAGFSTGGGLNGRALPGVSSLPNVYGITVGVPGWFPTYSSERSMVLDNRHRDPVCCGDVATIAMSVFKAPLIWLRSRVTGQNLSLALSFQLPHHEYSWFSPEVGAPIVKFLEQHFKLKF